MQGNKYKALLNALIVSQDPNRTIIRKGGIIMEGPTVAWVGPMTELSTTSLLSKVTEPFDLKGDIVIPGLINLHCHLSDTKFRGFFEFENLQQYVLLSRLANMRLSPLECVDSSSINLSLAELISSGTTLVFGGRHTGKEFGLRTVSSYPLNKENPLLQEFWEAFPNGFKRFREDLVNSSLTLPAISIHSLRSIETQTLSLVHHVMERYKDTFLTVHVAEDQRTEEEIKSRHGCSSIQLLSNHGLLYKGRTLLVHAIHIDQLDLDTIANSETSVVDCPSSNVRLGHDLAPLEQMLQRGINICLGTDGSATNGSLNLLEEARSACILHNFHTKRRLLTPEQVLDMITLNAARALNYGDKLGSIERGKQADMVILDKNSLGLYPTQNIIYNLIYSSSAEKQVKSVLVAADFVYKDGRLLHKGRPEIIREFNAISKHVQEAAKESQWALPKH